MAEKGLGYESEPNIQKMTQLRNEDATGSEKAKFVCNSAQYNLLFACMMTVVNMLNMRDIISTLWSNANSALLSACMTLGEVRE